MFKNIGIFVKEKSNQDIDKNALDSMIASLAANKEINLYIDESSNYQNQLVGSKDHKTFTEKYDGTSWTVDAAMATGRNSAGGSGISSNALIAGASYPGVTAVEEYSAAVAATKTVTTST